MGNDDRQRGRLLFRIVNLAPWVLALTVFCQPVAGVEPVSDPDSEMDSVNAVSGQESVEQTRDATSNTRSTAPQASSQ